MGKRLEFKERQKTSYCIPLWLRDQQIKHSVKRPIERIQVGEKKDDPIAIVGFGPSLNDTWEQIKGFKYVMSCSGAHKFLVERGIVPTWHVEVDPRAHKVKLIGEPQKDTEYLISSTCHPAVFEHLKDYKVKLWHVYDSTEDGDRLIPRGEYALTGGCDVGLRCLTMAAFLGFRDLHIFGLDGSAREAKHAAEHPNKVPDFNEVEYPEGSGKLWKVTAGMLEAAKQVGHELNMLPALKFKFYGEGLIQEMYRDYTPTLSKAQEKFTNYVAYAKQELISEEYRNLNSKLHDDNLAYGVGGAKHAPRVLKLVEKLQTQSVLDYGCGKGLLAKELSFPIWEYDPAVSGKNETPRPADLVVCTDVLEHIEPERLEFVLEDLKRCMKKCGYFTIHTGPSIKTLADGRNAHLIQEKWEWWKERLEQFFKVVQYAQSGPVIYTVVVPKLMKRSVQLSAKAA